MDLTQIDWKKEAQLEQLFPFTREGVLKGAHNELRDRQDATSRFIFAALLTKNDSVIGAIRRELKRIVDVNVGEEEIVRCLENEVIKRDTLEGPAATEAVGRVRRAGKKSLRAESKAEPPELTLPVTADVVPAEVPLGDVTLAADAG